MVLSTHTHTKVSHSKQEHKKGEITRYGLYNVKGCAIKYTERGEQFICLFVWIIYKSILQCLFTVLSNFHSALNSFHLKLVKKPDIQLKMKHVIKVRSNPQNYHIDVF